MDLLKFLASITFMLLTHCGDKKPTSPPTPPVSVPVISTQCYGNHMSVENVDLYEDFLAEALGGSVCCQTGKTLGWWGYQLCSGNLSCKKIAGYAPLVLFNIEPGYKKIKKLSLVPRSVGNRLIPPIILGEVVMNPVNKNRGWSARFYVPLPIQGSTGADLELYCERCDFEDRDRPMEVEIRYRNQRIGAITVIPERPATSQQCGTIGL